MGSLDLFGTYEFLILDGGHRVVTCGPRMYIALAISHRQWVLNYLLFFGDAYLYCNQSFVYKCQQLIARDTVIGTYIHLLLTGVT